MPTTVDPAKARTTGDRLRRLRGDRPQKMIADGAGISQSLLSHLEHGQKDLHEETAEKLASVLGAEVLDLAVDHASLPGYLTTRQAALKLNPPDDPAVMRRLCMAGKIKPKPIRRMIDGRMRWLVPENFKIDDTDRAHLSEKQKNVIVRKYLKGQTGKMLSDEYDIDPSYPRQLINRGYPKYK